MSDTPAFEEFAEITRFQQNVTITEKVHGTNAQILIEDVTETIATCPNTSLFGILEAQPKDWNIKVEPFCDNTSMVRRSYTSIKAGSRNRWVTPEDDNFGFARWVHDNAAGLIQILGPGRHYGEWFGSGINHAYGLKGGEKRFLLFNTHRWAGLLPEFKSLGVIPVLYSGPWKPGIVEEVMAKLKLEGSQAVPGCMIPEGVVVSFDKAHVLFKQVFDAESSAWQGKGPSKERAPDRMDREAVNALYHPIRLEKLLSRDERFLREYPKSLPEIVKAYVADMEKEAQFEGVEESTVKAAKKGLFLWVKDWMTEKGYSS